MKYDLVIFDLDGTTLNTLEDLADACNHALALNGFPTHDLEKIRTSVGSGVARLIDLTVPDGTTPEIRAKVLAEFKAYYASHVNVKTAPYPGITAMLCALKNAGVRVATNSNKFDAAVQTLSLTHFGDLVSMALGERSDIPKKPSPEGVYRIMNALSASKERTLFVGDSNIDLLTAQNAGIDCAWVSWGFRSREELGDLEIPHAFDSAQELAEFILS